MHEHSSSNSEPIHEQALGKDLVTVKLCQPKSGHSLRILSNVSMAVPAHREYGITKNKRSTNERQPSREATKNTITSYALQLPFFAATEKAFGIGSRSLGGLESSGSSPKSHDNSIYNEKKRVEVTLIPTYQTHCLMLGGSLDKQRAAILQFLHMIVLLHVTFLLHIPSSYM